MYRTLVFSVAVLALMAVPFTVRGANLSERDAANDKPVRLMAAEKENRLLSRMPNIDAPMIQRILADPALILYTEAEMPKAYQDWGSGLPGIHSPQYNISADGSEPYGNGNVEFPWGTPGGTHRTNNVTAFRFLWLPRDAAGKLRPVVWFRTFLRGDNSQGYAWRYPVGTVFGEVLSLRAPNGSEYVFEVRLRIREYGDWAVDVFRPFPTSEDLAERIRQLRPEWQKQPTLAKLVQHLDEPRELRSHTLADRRHSEVTFEQSMGVDRLPPVGDDELVVQLLTQTTFKSAMGTNWRTGSNGVSTCAPTTDQPFHIVPANYDAGFLEVDQISCMRCHETVNQHVNRFNFGRDWYGRIRGSDGIFSFHPFARDSISYNGIANSVRLNSKLVGAGLLERYDVKRHPHRIYHQVRFLKE
jgi:hypothetical protein